MAVIGVERLRSFLSNPRWSAEQEAEAAELLDNIEGSLAAALYHTKITPTPVAERCPVLASGLVSTRYPVHRVLTIGDVDIADGEPLPGDWRIEDHRLYRGIYHRSAAYAGQSAAASIYATGSLTATTGGGADDTVDLAYMAGWGPHPALVLAILRKAKAIYLHNHDDSLVARGTDAAPPPGVGEEHWTEEELLPLGVFRRLSGGA